MRIIPAIDLKGGVVVHAVAGRRAEYRPLVSMLAGDPHPATVARGFIDALGLSEFYVADLDAIAGDEPDWSSYDALIGAGGTLWIDAGIADVRRAEVLAKYAEQHPAVTGVIVGLESLADARDIRQIRSILGPERSVFSLDLLAGVPRVQAPQWQGVSSLKIAADVVASGIRRLIVLDVGAVGLGQGCPTLHLCGELRRGYQEVEIATGGGVSRKSELEAIAAEGCHATLLATALHDGRIRRDTMSAI